MNKKGVTLIELLAVIVIMGLIAAIAIPVTIGIINSQKRGSHVASAQALMRSIENCVNVESDDSVCGDITGNPNTYTTKIADEYINEADFNGYTIAYTIESNGKVVLSRFAKDGFDITNNVVNKEASATEIPYRELDKDDLSES